MKIETLQEACDAFNRYKYEEKGYFRGIHILTGTRVIETRWNIRDYSNNSKRLYQSYYDKDTLVDDVRFLTEWEAITLAQALEDKLETTENE